MSTKVELLPLPSFPPQIIIEIAYISTVSHKGLHINCMYKIQMEERSSSK